MTNLPITVCDVQLAKDIIRIELGEFHGSPTFSAWKWFLNNSGKLQAGSHGLTFEIGQLPEVLAAFEKGLERARAERLL